MRQSNCRAVLLAHHPEGELDRKGSLQRGSMQVDPFAPSDVAPAAMARSLAMHLTSSSNDQAYRSAPSLLDMADKQARDDDDNSNNNNNSNNNDDDMLKHAQTK
jgi:hypothetical protein